MLFKDFEQEGHMLVDLVAQFRFIGNRDYYHLILIGLIDISIS